MSKDDEIKEVRIEQERRGKRPVDIAGSRRRSILRTKFREALECNDEELFKRTIVTVLGQLPGSDEYERSVRIWRQMHDDS
jgi:hypothetical protein